MLALLLGTLAFAADEEEEAASVTFDVEGYYRLRLHHFNGLYDPESWSHEPGTGRYMSQRLRLTPSANFDDRAKLFMTFDALDDVVMGDNMSEASTALFAGGPTDTFYGDGQPGTNFRVQRIWTEFTIPVGVIRVGRQPSDWGMGLLANDGNGFDDVWGENHNGATFDRFMFATKPLAIANAFTGKGNPNTPLFFAIGYDRLVEDPLIQYYGYECDPDDPDDDPRCAEDDDHGTTEDRNAANRPDNWWTEHDDDVWEMIYVLVYKGEDVNVLGKPSDLTAGVYAVNRRQVETSSNILIVDAYTRLVRRHLYFETEWLHIRGESSAISLPGTTDPSAVDPLYKKPRITGGVTRLGYQSQPRDATFEFGFASGDDNPTDERFTGRPLHADYNAGLLLYEEVLSRVTAYGWTESAQGLWSNGGVYNSYYVFPQVRHALLPGWDVYGGFLVAFPHKPDGAMIRTDDDADSAILGWEADLALKMDFQEHMRFSLESGYCQLSDRIPYEDRGIATNGSVWTVQSRIAYEF